MLRPAVLSLTLLLVAAPLASAGGLSGELTSDAPVTALGSGTAAGSALSILHYAFRDASLSGTAYSGYILDRWTLHVPEDQPRACHDAYEGRTESEHGATADPGLIYTVIDYSLAAGSFARLALPQNEIRFFNGKVGEPRDDAAPFLQLGPNPYRFETQQSPAKGDVADHYVPAFATTSYVAVPTQSFSTALTAAHPMTIQLLWGDLSTVQQGRTRPYHAGIVETQRNTSNSGPLPTSIKCKVLETHVIEFQQQFASLTIDQDGVERPMGFWRGGSIGTVANSEASPEGYWDLTRSGEFGSALEALRMPATVVAATDLRVATSGGARFERALGALHRDGHTDEVKDRGITITGAPVLQPLADEDGHRMTTKISGEATLVPDSGSSSSTLSRNAPAIAAFAGGFAAIGAVSWLWPVLRFKGTALLLTPLYARLKKEDLLENPLRDDILEVVNTQPGISASELGRRLDCGWGTLVYHLTVLERMQLISSAREGRHKRFFVQGRINYSDKGAVGLLANPSAKLVLDAIAQTPGQIQRDLSRRLGLSPGTVAWHVERLAEAGLVIKEEDGRVVRYYPSNKLLELTKQLAA